MSTVDETKLRYLEYMHREMAVRHQNYDDEMYRYHMLKAGDLQAVEESLRTPARGAMGTLSGDPVRNAITLVVAAVNISCRFAILGGLEEQRSYNLTDL